jgi:predicted kinase
LLLTAPMAVGMRLVLCHGVNGTSHSALAGHLNGPKGARGKG